MLCESLQLPLQIFFFYILLGVFKGRGKIQRYVEMNKIKMLEVKFTNNQQNVKTKQIEHRTCKIFLKETSLIYLTHKNESGWFIGESWMLCFLPCE